MELTKTDVHFVMSRCPKDVRRLLILNAGKVFLAGGFVRAVIAGEKVSDIDLFGGSTEHLLSVAKDLTLRRKGRYFETDNAITVLTGTRYPVQFITRWLYTKAEDLIKSFDFTIAQSVIWAEVIDPTAEVKKGKLPKIIFKSLIADTFYADLAARRLTYTMPVREEEAGGSMMRVLKFIKRGYNIQPASLAGVIARLAIKLDFRRQPDVEWVQIVLKGLLYEVDPMIVIDGIDFLDEHEALNNE